MWWEGGGIDDSLYLRMNLFLLIWNCIVFGIYAVDKVKAKRGSWRIAESTLLLATFLAGGFGGFAAVRLLRHKSRHLKFQILTLLAFLLTTGLVLYLTYLYQM